MPRRCSFLLQVAALAATLSFGPPAPARAAERELTLHYDKAATTRTEALPIGNGRIGPTRDFRAVCIKGERLSGERAALVRTT